MPENIIRALQTMQQAAESGKMKPEDYFDIGVIAGRNEKPESTDDPEKKTA